MGCECDIIQLHLFIMVFAVGLLFCCYRCACDWNPSCFERVGMRDPKYPMRSMPNTAVDSVILNFI